MITTTTRMGRATTLVVGLAAVLGLMSLARAETTLGARTLGLFDVTAEVWFDDNDHLAEVLDDLRAVPGVGSIETVPYLQIVKEQFGRRTGGPGVVVTHDVRTNSLVINAPPEQFMQATALIALQGVPP